jgi:acetolactate decarboxylase
LLAGAYDGRVACGTLTRQGDVGLGTFDRLDGEMIVLDGHIYQVRADGRVYSPRAGVTTPFAAVVRFRPTVARELSGGITFREFQRRLDGCRRAESGFPGCVPRDGSTFRKRAENPERAVQTNRIACAAGGSHAISGL